MVGVLVAVLVLYCGQILGQLNRNLAFGANLLTSCAASLGILISELALFALLTALVALLAALALLVTSGFVASLATLAVPLWHILAGRKLVEAGRILHLYKLLVLCFVEYALHIGCQLLLLGLHLLHTLNILLGLLEAELIYLVILLISEQKLLTQSVGLTLCNLLYGGHFTLWSLRCLLCKCCHAEQKSSDCDDN